MCADTVSSMHSRARARKRKRKREREREGDAVIIVSYILPQESGKLIRFTFIGQSSPMVRIVLFLTRCDSRESAQYSRD